MPDLKTNATLLEALKDAASRGPSAAELEQQRLSFIMGSLKTSSDMTRAQVEEILAQHEGKRTA